MDSNYFGAASTLVKKQFNVDFIEETVFGWLEPQADSGVGTASLVNSMVVATISPTSGAKIGVGFWYNSSVNIRHRYFISCNSADWVNALSTTTNVNTATSLTVATGSGYTLIP